MYIYGRTAERVAEYMIVGFAMQPEFFALKDLYKITGNKKKGERGVWCREHFLSLSVKVSD